jgi:hypothetical protein
MTLSVQQRAEMASDFLCKYLKLVAPKDTWNLTINGIHTIYEDGTYYVLVGGETAPYAVSTNEKWAVGRNPNEGWLDKAIDTCVKNAFPLFFQGTYEKIDIENLQKINDLKNAVTSSYENLRKATVQKALAKAENFKKQRIKLAEDLLK